MATVAADISGSYNVVFTVTATGCPLCADANDSVSDSAVAFSMDLIMQNGGSDLDNGDAAGSLGPVVAEDDEENVGGYILVNWDDDDSDGSMNPDGSWAVDPVPDLHEPSVQNEDNLARLTWFLSDVPDTGTISLETVGYDVQVRAWSSSTKGTNYNLHPSAWNFDLSVPSQRNQFILFGQNGLWIEGAMPSSTERDVSFTLRYRDAGGAERCADTVKATVVMINLANAVYKEHVWWVQNNRGHAALIWTFLGPLTRANLNDDTKYLLIEMDGPTNSYDLTSMTQHPNYPPFGCFTNPTITYRQRLMVLQAAKSLAARGVGYTPFNAVLGTNDPDHPKRWNARLDTIGWLRCDGLVEVCYEINGVEVWGMVGRPPDGGSHHDITDLTDLWSYNETTGNWTQAPNGEPDNLEAHNDFDNGFWLDTLMPATQCGHVTPQDASTRFQPLDLCIPVGTKGGNP